MNIIGTYYLENKRDFPWRITDKNNKKKIDTYKILVSEIMLQQTQADRVVLYYTRWCKLFPTIASLSRASLKEVLPVWQGLGYNRRAKYLLEGAKQIELLYGGKVPTEAHQLEMLPGVGKYTAGAIIAFAYNEPSVFLETNIRTVLIHHFYEGWVTVSEKELFVTAQALWEYAEGEGWQSRAWGYALMDYGAFLKKNGSNHVARSQGYKKQSTFKGSKREVRGLIIKELTKSNYTKGACSKTMLVKKLKKSKAEIEGALLSLVKDGMIGTSKSSYHLLG